MSIGKADFKATGSTSEDGPLVATAIGTEKGEVRFTEGEIMIWDTVMSYPDDTYLTGAGISATALIVDDIDAIDWTFAGNGGMRFLTVKEQNL